jgi:hypothetical protein
MLFCDNWLPRKRTMTTIKELKVTANSITYISWFFTVAWNSVKTGLTTLLVVYTTCLK